MGLDTVRRFTGPLLGISFMLLIAVRLPGLGHGTAGAQPAQRWLGFGPLQFEPSELAKLALVLYAAHIFSSGRPSARATSGRFKRLLLVGGSGCLLVATQPDLGTTLVIAFALVAVTVAAGVPARTLVIAGALCLVRVGVFALAEPYAAARLTSFADPWAHATTTGYQAVQSQIAIGSGGLFGRGPGASLQKDFWLPEASTDFILAVVGEELGFVGIAALLLLYGLIAFAGMRAARRATGTYAMLVAVGVTSLIVFQATLNVFAVLGHRAGDRRAAAVRLLRRVEPARDARRDGPAAERRERRERAPARGAQHAHARIRECGSRSPPAGQPGTWCRRSSSRTRCGRRGLRSSSSGATAPSARSCPRPATRSSGSTSRVSTGATRCARRARSGSRRERCCARGRCWGRSASTS